MRGIGLANDVFASIRINNLLIAFQIVLAGPVKEGAKT